MAISAARVAVGTTAVALNTAGTSGSRLLVQNAGAVVADLGGSGVTSGGGLELAVDAILAVELVPGDVLYAISSGAGTSLAVLRT